MGTITNTMVAVNKGQRTFQSVAAFARAANTTTYVTGDAVTDLASVTRKAILFPGCGPAGVINRVRLAIDDDDGTAAFALLLFDAEPTNFFDGEAIVLVDGDIEKLIGFWDFVNGSGVLVEVGGTWTTLESTASEPSSHPTPFSTAADGNLFGHLMVTAGYATPVTGMKINIRLQGTADLL